MFKKFTYAVTISALSALSLVSIASAAGPYADFTIANGDQNENVQQTVNVEQPVRMNIQASDDSDKPGAVLDYTNFSIANGDENEEVSNDQDTKVQPAVTVEQPTKLNIGGGDDTDQPTVNVGNHVRLNIGHGDDSDSPVMKLDIGASDPAEQA